MFDLGVYRRNFPKKNAATMAKCYDWTEWRTVIFAVFLLKTSVCIDHDPTE